MATLTHQRKGCHKCTSRTPSLAHHLGLTLVPSSQLSISISLPIKYEIKICKYLSSEIMIERYQHEGGGVWTYRYCMEPTS